jgi:hypothetical protein
MAGGDGLPLAWFGLSRPAAEVPPAPAPANGQRSYTAGAWAPAWSRSAYRDAFRRVKEALASGYTYQCNLTTMMETSFSGDTEEFYRDLIHAQRGHYGAYLDMGRHVIASASPELFFEWTGDKLRTRPMKGTATRGPDAAQDARRRESLLESPKERAENVIIVDLLRNDLNRVAETGTVAVVSPGPAIRTPNTTRFSPRPRSWIGGRRISSCSRRCFTSPVRGYGTSARQRTLSRRPRPASQGAKAARARPRNSSSEMPAASSGRSRRVPLLVTSAGWREVKPPSRFCCQP